MAPKSRTAHKPKFSVINRKCVDPVYEKTVIAEAKKLISSEAKEVNFKFARRTSGTKVPILKNKNSAVSRKNFNLSQNCDKFAYRPNYKRPFESRCRDLPLYVNKKIESLLSIQNKPQKKPKNKQKIIPIKGFQSKHVCIH